MMIVGVDIGGTFTDFIYFHEGKIQIEKLPSTPQNLSEAVFEGLKRVPKKITSLVHGTTIGTNTVLERKGAKTALITTTGFKDILLIGRQTRPHLYNLEQIKKRSLVPQENTFEIEERIDKDGKILKRLNEEQIKHLINTLKEREFQSVAISFLFSFINPCHELKLKQILEEKGFEISISWEILPQIREFERTSTTVINAYLLPVMKEYLSSLETGLIDIRDLRIMQSNGGSISFEFAKRYPVSTLFSGPAAGVIGALEVAKRAGYKKVITFDMGGTSTDVSLCEGEVKFTPEAKIEDWPLCLPVVDIHTVGAGGGSIAYIDLGGALRVGPESAGADPGPICYGKGEKLTVTDANLILGRLDKDHFLGGRMKLDLQKTQLKFEEFSKKLNLSPEQTALSIIKVVNSNMERAIRVISIEKGYDPREFTLVAFGGAGGLHAAWLIEALDIPQALIPKDPGTLSAFGLILADIIKDYSKSIKPKSNLELEFDRFINQTQKDFPSNKGFTIERFVDARYKGQSYELTIPFRTKDNLVQDFHQAHQKNYGYADLTQEVEIVNLKIRFKSSPSKPRLKKYPLKGKDPSKAQIKEKEVYFDKYYKTLLFDRRLLACGNEIQGPGIIIEDHSTVVIPPGFKGRVDKFLNIIISKEI
jgi:N-methylhydantoinase A